MAIKPLDIFSQTPYYATSAYSGAGAYVAPSRTAVTIPNIALTSTAGAAYGGDTNGAVNHGVEQGSMNLPSGNYHNANAAYGSWVTADLGLDAPLIEPVRRHSCCADTRTAQLPRLGDISWSHTSSGDNSVRR